MINICVITLVSRTQPSGPLRLWQCLENNAKLYVNYMQFYIILFHLCNLCFYALLWVSKCREILLAPRFTSGKSSKSSAYLSFWLMVAKVPELVWHCLGLLVLSNITLLPRCRLTDSPAAHSHTRAQSHPCHSSLLFPTSGFSVIGQLKNLAIFLALQKLLNLESSRRALWYWW